MQEFWFSADAIVFAAGVTYVLGCLIINQVGLRLMLALGTFFYIWYYFVAADAPLWGAIFVSCAIGVANFIGLTNLYLRKSRIHVPRAHRDIYDKHFKHMPPADFRSMIRQGTRKTLRENQIATREGQPVDTLYFVISGDVTIEKLGECFKAPSGMFVGEIAYLTGRASSATTYLDAGSEVITWKFKTLRRWADRKPRSKLAFEAMISHDLAMKVTVAVAPRKVDLLGSDIKAVREKLRV